MKDEIETKIKLGGPRIEGRIHPQIKSLRTNLSILPFYPLCTPKALNGIFCQASKSTQHLLDVWMVLKHLMHMIQMQHGRSMPNLS